MTKTRFLWTTLVGGREGGRDGGREKGGREGEGREGERVGGREKRKLERCPSRKEWHGTPNRGKTFSTLNELLLVLWLLPFGRFHFHHSEREE